MDRWRSGSVSDSSPDGPRFKSESVHLLLSIHPVIAIHSFRFLFFPPAHVDKLTLLILSLRGSFQVVVTFVVAEVVACPTNSHDLLENEICKGRDW